MGLRGPKPKPDALKILKGNPGNDKLNTQAPVPVGEPRRPDYIEGYRLEVWNDVLRSMPDGLYTTADSHVLAAYAVACDSLRRSTMKIAELGEIEYAQSGNPKRSPWIDIQRTSMEHVARLGGLLGLDPSSRSRLVQPEQKNKKNTPALIKTG